MKADAHLHFDGRCEEAFKFYERVFNGKIEAMMHAAGSPVESHMGSPKAVMHARMKIGDTTIMGADTPPGRYLKPQGMSVTVRVDSAADAARIFSGLMEGGEITMAMAPTFFAENFGAGTDHYGTPWMIICEKKM